MTAVSVKAEIVSAMKNKIVSKAEVAKIDAAIGKSASTAEAKPIGDLYQQLTGPRPAVMLPPGEKWPAFGKGAEAKANAMFVARGLPFGDNEAPIRARMESALARIRMVPLAEPPKVDKLIPVWLPGPEGLMDGPTRTAHYDVTNERFYLHVRDSWRPEGVSRWFGPLSIKGVEPLPEEPAEPVIEPETLDRAARAFDDFAMRALFDWDTLPQSMPMGARTIEQEFRKERRPDGFAYSAVFSLGALAPGAPAADPNLLDEVFIKRSGPDGDRILGPIDMTTMDGGVKAATLRKLRAALDAYQGDWTLSPPLIPPGGNVTNVLLRKEPGFDTYQYDAMLVGDANAPQSIVLARSGGLMGRTMYSAPVSID